MANTVTARFIKKARAEYDGYLLIEGDYAKESFRIAFENMRDMSNEVDALTATVIDLSARLKLAENKLAIAQLDITTHTH